MKTLVLNGSPRHDGNTAALLKKVLEAARGEIIRADAFACNISACSNCGRCSENKKCVNPDMNDIYAAAEDADNVIIASPVYFGGLTPPLLSIMSRFQTYYSGADYTRMPVIGKRKRGIVILTGGGDSGIKNRAGVYARFLLKMMNVEIIERISSLQTNQLPATEDAEAMARAEAAGKDLFSVKSGGAE